MNRFGNQTNKRGTNQWRWYVMTRSKSWARGAVLSVAALVIGLGLAACGGGGGGGGPKIALLLPESKTTRYETQDQPLFEAAVKAACPDCELIYSNADQDAAEQQSQAEAALTNGADVVVLDPVDSASAASIVNQAKQQNVPVVELRPADPRTRRRRLLRLVRQRQGRRAPGQRPGRRSSPTDGNATGPIVMINGSPTDNNAKLFKAGRAQRLDAARRPGRQGVRHPGLEPRQGPDRDGPGDHALGKNGFKGVYADERRHRRRRDRRDEGRRHRSEDDPDHRSGRRARRRSSGSSPATST